MFSRTALESRRYQSELGLPNTSYRPSMGNPISDCLEPDIRPAKMRGGMGRTCSRLRPRERVAAAVGRVESSALRSLHNPTTGRWGVPPPLPEDSRVERYAVIGALYAPFSERLIWGANAEFALAITRQKVGRSYGRSGARCILDIPRISRMISRWAPIAPPAVTSGPIDAWI